MKTFFSTTLLVFLFLGANVAQAQTPQGKLNQVELHKQFVGSWKCAIAKDTTFIWEVKPYGRGFECSFKYVTKEKICAEGKQLWGYDKSIDKCLISEMFKGMDIMIYATWFISKDKCEMLPYSDISNPEKASLKVVSELKSPDSFLQTTFVNNKPVKVDTYTRVK